MVYIIVPPAATPKMLAIELAAFLGLPVSSRDRPARHHPRRLPGCCARSAADLVLVDEIHRLDLPPASAPKRRTS